MANFIGTVVRQGIQGVSFAKNQVAALIGSSSNVGAVGPLNKKFVEPIVVSTLYGTYREHIKSVGKVFAGAILVPQLSMADAMLVGRVAAIFVFLPSLRAAERLINELPYRRQVLKEEELFKKYAGVSDVEIKKELRGILTCLPGFFYDSPTQELIKIQMKSSSVERGCVPMLIRYKIALEKYESLEREVRLIEAIGSKTPSCMKQKLYVTEFPFFKKLFFAKLEAALGLAILCHPQEMKALDLKELGQVNPFFPEGDIEYADIPFFIKRDYKLKISPDSYCKFSNRDDFFSCKEIGDSSLMELAEDLFNVQKSFNDPKKIMQRAQALVANASSGTGSLESNDSD
jgi:hypothetical protein